MVLICGLKRPFSAYTHRDAAMSCQGPPSSLLLVHVETTCRVHCEEVIVLVHVGDIGDRALVVVFLGHLVLVVCSCLLRCPNAV